jgi:hypothetical protein
LEQQGFDRQYLSFICVHLPRILLILFVNPLKQFFYFRFRHI